MSAIGGVWFAEARRHEVAPSLERMTRALEPWGPGDGQVHVEGRLGMVWRDLEALPLEHRGRQPLRGGDVTLTFDGRLDARDDLAHALGCSPRLPDPPLVLAAYRRWGGDFASHLLGDYALALWDGARRRLLLARDPFDTRPLFYAETPGELAWSTNLRGLTAARPDLPLEPDEAWIAGFFAGDVPVGHSALRAFRVVPPGCVLETGGESTEIRPTWHPENLPEIRYHDDRDYEEHFRHLFTTSVRDRLRASGPVFCELSGGMDSSSITCVADGLLRRGEAAASGLETVSYVFSGTRSADEREWMRHVEEHTGRPAHSVDERDHPLLDGFDEGAAYESPCHLPVFKRRYQRVAELMRGAGSRVILSGVGGDNVVWGEYSVAPQLADLAARGEVRALWRELRRWQPTTGFSYVKILWEGVVQQLWPALGRGQERARWHVPWASEGFVERQGLASGRHPGARPEASLSRPSQRAQLRMIREAAHWQVALSYLEGEVLGAERRYPFLDRRLVELCLAIPAEQFARPGETRSLHRRALRRDLPPAIVKRHGKRSPEEALIRAVAREWPKLAEIFRADALVYQLGYVDRGRFTRALDHKRFGLVDGGSVQNVIELEVWLRSLYGERLVKRAA